MKIDRCVCHEKSFAYLLKVAEDHDCASLESLQKHVTFGSTCGLCHIYIERTLKTKEVEFYQVLQAETPSPKHKH